MKILTQANWTGMVETELFAQKYRRYGLAAVRCPVFQIPATGAISACILFKNV
jgi:hypothetical protein